MRINRWGVPERKHVLRISISLSMNVFIYIYTHSANTCVTPTFVRAVGHHLDRKTR